VSGWIELWTWCHAPGFAGPVRTAWPDGRSLLEQPAVVVRVFDLITEITAEVARTDKQ
jgi:hypothetical protein